MVLLPSKLNTRRRLVENYDHMCGLGPERDVLFLHKTGIFASLKCFLRRHSVVSELNPRANKYCRSQNALHVEQKNQLKHYPFILHPISNLRKYWEYFMILIISFSMVYSPMLSCFSFLPHLMKISTIYNSICIIVLHYLQDALLILDMIINFLTGYYNEQREIVLGKKDIAIYYLKTFLVMDILSSLPSSINNDFQDFTPDFKYYFNNVLLQLKFLRIFSYFYYISHWLEVMQIRNYYCKSVLLVLTTFIAIHWITCWSIVVAAVSVNLPNSNVPTRASWLTEHGLYNSSITLIYFTSLFRISCIVSCAEYESMDATTDKDVWFESVIWVMSNIFYTALVCFLVQITRSVTSSQSKYKEMVLQLMQYMHHKQLSVYTQRRLISYYEFRYQKSFFREAEILHTISGQLRQEILMLRCLKLVENVPFFKGLPQSLLMRIVMYLQLEIYLANDTIIKAKTGGSSMYFIGTGTVALYSETGKEIYRMEDGEYFGEIELIMSNTARVASVIAIEACELYRLDRTDFIHVIRPYPDLLESIEQIAAERLQHIQAIDNKFKFFYKERHNKDRNT